MLPKKGVDRISGVLLIGLAVATVLTIATGLIDVTAESFSKTFQGLVENQGRQYLTLVVLHVSSVLVLVLAATLYLAFRPFDRALALVGALGLVALGFTFIMANVAGGALVNIAEEYETVSAAKSDMLLASARAITMLQVFTWFDGAFTFLPLSLLAFGAIITRSNALPRWLGWLGIAAGVVMPTMWLSQHPFLIEAFWVVAMIGMMGSLLWLLLVGGWLLVSGTRQSAAVHATV